MNTNHVKILTWVLMIGILLAGCGPSQFVASPISTLTSTTVPSPEPTITLTPTLKTETIEGNIYTLSGGFEAQGASGTLKYVKDINGKWIKAPFEVKVSIDTDLGTRLGTDFSLGADGTSITAVDGLTINKEKGTATFNFDVKGEETFSTGDIHVVSKDVNGQPMKRTLLLAGYAWNPESKKWDIYNPGFPMDTAPREELGWFNQEDIANGNWLRWHQRVLQGVDLNNKFTGALKADSWTQQDLFNNITDQNLDGKLDVIHVKGLSWISGGNDYTYRTFTAPSERKLDPTRPGLSFSYLDSGMVIISCDIKNPDGTITSLPLLMDDILWTTLSNIAGNLNFIRTALANGVPHNTGRLGTETTWDNSNDNESWDVIPVLKVENDATIMDYGGEKEMSLLQNPDGVLGREKSIDENKINPTGSLYPWGTHIVYNYHKGPSIP